MLKKLLKLRKDRKGQGLVEYAFIVAAVAFICLLALSVFGHKLSDQYAVMAGMLPGAHGEDNLPITSQSYLQYDENADGDAIISTGRISWVDIVSGDPTDNGLQNNVVVAGGGIGATDGDVFVAD